MPRTPLPISVIQNSIYAQLQASQDIFDQIHDLAKIAERYNDNTDLVADIQRVMQRLLTIGDTLSVHAKRTGDEILTFVTVQE